MEDTSELREMFSKIGFDRWCGMGVEAALMGLEMSFKRVNPGLTDEQMGGYREEVTKEKPRAIDAIYNSQLEVMVKKLEPGDLELLSELADLEKVSSYFHVLLKCQGILGMAMGEVGKDQLVSAHAKGAQRALSEF